LAIKELTEMVKQINRKETRAKRQLRVRSKISGTAERPRLNVFRSAKHIYAQLIDDKAGVTLAAASSMEKDFGVYGGNIDAAKKVGALIAERAKGKGLTAVVFDRAGYLYHGRVAAVAEGAREGGLEF
jgi:large subunit ribosomal protein L18